MTNTMHKVFTCSVYVDDVVRLRVQP